MAASVETISDAVERFSPSVETTSPSVETSSGNVDGEMPDRRRILENVDTFAAKLRRFPQNV
jgi:hypothetical protein